MSFFPFKDFPAPNEVSVTQSSIIYSNLPLKQHSTHIFITYLGKQKQLSLITREKRKINNEREREKCKKYNQKQ